VTQVSFFINLCVVAVFAKGFYYSNPRYTGDIGLSVAGTKLEQVCVLPLSAAHARGLHC